MSTKRKISLACAAFVLLVVIVGVSSVLYLYYHPQTLKAFLVESVERTTGASLHIDRLTYGLIPLRVTAEGIIVRHGEVQHELEVKLSAVNAAMALEGPFGRRTLIIEDLTINGLGFRLPEAGTLSQPTRRPTEPSWLGAVARRVVAYLFFEEIELKTVLISGGDIQARMGTYDVHLHDVTARRTTEGLLTLSGGLRSRSTATDRNFTVQSIEISTDQAISLVDSQIGCRAKIEGAVFDSNEIEIRGLTGAAEVVFRRALQGTILRDLALQIEKATIRQGPEIQLTALKLVADQETRFSWRENRLEAPHLRLALDEILSCDFQLDAFWAAPTTILIKSIEGRLAPRKALALLPEQVRRNLAPLKLAGPLKLRGRLEGHRASEKWGWDYDLKGLLKGNAVSIARKPIQIDGIVDGFVQAKGRWPEMAVFSTLSTAKTTLQGVGMELNPFRARITVKGQPPIFEIEKFEAELPWIQVPVGQREIAFVDARLEAQDGRLDGTRNTLKVPQMRFHSASLTNLLLSLTASPGDVSLELQGQKTGLLESMQALDVMPADWLISGNDRLDLKINAKGGNDFTFTSRLTLENLDFQNSDGSRMGAKVDGQFDTRGTFHLKQRQITLDADLKARQGEVLFDRFYLDFEKTPLVAAAEAHIDIAGNAVNLKSGQLGLENIMQFDLSGHVADWRGDRTLSLAVALSETPLLPIYSHFLFEPFHMERPVLNGIEVGGNVSAEVRFENDDTFEIKGSCRWRDGNLVFPEHGARCNGIDLDFPLWYRSDGGTNPKQRARGRLAIDSLALPLLPEQALDVVLEAGPDELSVPTSLTFGIAGGQLRLGSIRAKDFYTQGLSVRTSLDLTANDLNPFLNRVWPQPIQGTLHGRLDPLHIHKRTLSGKGTLTARAFGGKVFLTDIAVARLLTPTQLLRLTARWQDLNLDALTRGTTFGRIEGVLQGHAENLEIVSGQPQRFDLLLETVKTRGIPQRISVTAVDNIAQIGGGQSPFIGMAGALSTFFKEFPYEKIGLRATLENDVFRINGTIKEDDKEYIVKRGGFSGVNIVNQNPDNQISFKDMLKRIKRVTADGARPVIE